MSDTDRGSDAKQLAPELRHTILLIDDDPFILEALRTVLRAHSYRVLTPECLAQLAMQFVEADMGRNAQCAPLDPAAQETFILTEMDCPPREGRARLANQPPASETGGGQ